MDPPSPLPLLLKLAAAAAATGTAALLSFRRHHRAHALRSLRRGIHDAILLLPVPAGTTTSAPPPSILIVGFGGHGKSAFINTACRALADEAGPLLFRAETAPPGSPPATAGWRAVRAAVASGGGWSEEEDEEGVAVELIEAPPLPEPGAMRRTDVEKVVDGAGESGGDKVARSPECVVVVLRCGRPARERHVAVRRLTDIAGVVRDRGLQLVVVLTHKTSLRSRKQAEELRREVAFRARTDCVFFIENYAAAHSAGVRSPAAAFRNSFDTHSAALAIIRQCVEFAGIRRRQSPGKMINLSTSVEEKSQELKEK